MYITDSKGELMPFNYYQTEDTEDELGVNPGRRSTVPTINIQPHGESPYLNEKKLTKMET